mmetsp:Transcript_60736/g.144653  ORF Transcript_60736/g.144653 Transcript_60736/m.144653 type:complete len:208 (+) Transcript_60736:1470-2093(+)
MSVILLFTKLTTISSFSKAATLLTTSQRTPMSMFITVRDASKTNKKKITVQSLESLLILCCNQLMSSNKVPCSHNVYMDCSTVRNSSLLCLASARSWVIAIAKTYMRMSNSNRVKTTDLLAASMPLIKIINSGMARKRRAILAILVRRRRRAILRTEVLPAPPPAPAPVRSVIPVMIQVSETIMNTRPESNRNHASFKQSRLRLNAM